MERFLTGFRVKFKTLEKIASEYNFSLFPSDKSPFFTKEKIPDNCFLLAGNLNETTLKKLNYLPFSGIIDANAQKKSLRMFLSDLPKNEHHLSFLCTSPLIYSVDIADFFVKKLSESLNLSDQMKTDIRLALHETLINALVHGNLEISTGQVKTAYDFMNYTNLLQERLKSSSFAKKSVCIYASWNTHKLVIRVKDEGNGYKHKKNTTTIKKKTSGRGLIFIAGLADSCTLSDNGSEVTLIFDLKECFTRPYLSSEEEHIQKHLKNMPTLSKGKVLIVERNMSSQMMLCRLLNMLGITNLEVASSGMEGLKKAGEFQPDLIILDVELPQMSGYDLLYLLKNKTETKHIPILIETANDTREARDKTFKMGATDFITKPINPLEFFSRIKVQLENGLLLKHLHTQLSRIQEELSIAKEMQHSLIPSETYLENVGAHYKMEMYSHFEPTNEIGGDFWGIIPLNKEKAGFYICDFSGHGISAALNTFRLHALISQTDAITLSAPAHTVATLNNQMRKLLPRGQFATFLYGIIDTERNLLSYASAGSPRPLLKMPDGKFLRLRSSGMPLGIKKDICYENHQVPFPPESLILFYSDALLDACNSEGEQLGEKGFFEIATTAFCQKRAKDIIPEIIQKFYEYSPMPLEDDLTAFLIKREK